MRNLRTSVAPLIAVVTAAGCYSSQLAPPPPPPVAAPRVVQHRRSDAELVAELCPLRVPDSVVAAQDVENGTSLVFTTTGDVSEVRRRVRAMADLQGFNRELIARTVRTTRSLQAAHHYVEDVEGGARIVFRPPHATDLFDYREQVNFEAMRLRAGECPMPMPPQAEPENEGVATAAR